MRSWRRPAVRNPGRDLDTLLPRPEHPGGVPTPRGLGGRHVRRPVAGMAGVVALLTAVVAGCGIRATSVPTDVGAAPSRASCSDFAARAEAEPAQGVAVQVFLVCTTQLVTVERTVPMPTGEADEGTRFARTLLDQLQKRPSAHEMRAGYTTDVLEPIKVGGGHTGEPRHTLRLGTPPSELSPYALAQIVCTLANSPAAADDGSVILGALGPEPLRHYHCTPELRTHPGTTAPPTSPVKLQG